MTEPIEAWLPVVGWEGIYEVSSLGRVRRVLAARGTYAGRMLKTNGKGYPQVGLHRAGRHEVYKVATLVAAAFVGPRPEGTEVCHGDGDKQNSAASNLRYDTHLANEDDKRRHGTHHNTRKTQCRNGHEYTPENTYINPKGRRECRTCKRSNSREQARAARTRDPELRERQNERSREWKARNREKVNAYKRARYAALKESRPQR